MNFQTLYNSLLAMILLAFSIPCQSGPPSKTGATFRSQAASRWEQSSMQRCSVHNQIGGEIGKTGKTFTNASFEFESKRKPGDHNKELPQNPKRKNEQADKLEASSQIHQIQGNQRLALEELEKALTLRLNSNESSLHGTYALFSQVFMTLGNYPESLRYGLAALINAQEMGDTTKLSRYFLQLGYLYHDLKQPDRALESCAESLKHVVDVNKDNDSFNVLSLAVNVLLAQHRVKEALRYINKFVKATPPASLKSAAMLTLFKAQCYAALKQYPLASKHILLAEEYLRAIDNSNDPIFHNDSYRMGVYQVAGEIYMATKDYPKARSYFNKMVQVNKKVNYLSEKVLHELLLSKLDSAQENFKGALVHHQRYSFLKDSIFNDARSRQITNFQIQYETQSKVQRIALLTKKNEMQHALLVQNEFQQTVFIVGSILLSALLILAYRGFKAKKKHNKILEGKQDEINRKNESLNQLLADKEILLGNKDELLEEKGWLLKEVHHRVKNNLQIITSLLNSQAAYLNDTKALTAILDTQHRVHAMSLIHQKLYQSDKIATIAIDEYLKELVEHLSDSYNSDGKISFQLEILSMEMNVAMAVPLGLLVNEAVTNCIKYAFPDGKSGIVSLSLKEVLPCSYSLNIADTGIGIKNPSDFSSRRSLGMKLMEGLSKQLGGQLTLDNINGLIINVLFTPALINHTYGIEKK